jgi:hypothetical protein
VVAGLALAVGGAAFPAAAESRGEPSCVATITVWETANLPAGSIGAEVSGLAGSAPQTLSALVRELVRRHAGSIEGCGE